MEDLLGRTLAMGGMRILGCLASPCNMYRERHATDQEEDVLNNVVREVHFRYVTGLQLLSCRKEVRPGSRASIFRLSFRRQSRQYFPVVFPRTVCACASIGLGSQHVYAQQRAGGPALHCDRNNAGETAIIA